MRVLLAAVALCVASAGCLQNHRDSCPASCSTASAPTGGRISPTSTAGPGNQTTGPPSPTHNMPPPGPGNGTAMPSLKGCQAGWSEVTVNHTQAQALLPAGFSATQPWPGLAEAWMGITSCPGTGGAEFFGWTAIAIAAPSHDGVPAAANHFYLLRIFASPAIVDSLLPLGWPVASGPGKLVVTPLPSPVPAWTYSASLGPYRQEMDNADSRGAGANGTGSPGTFNETDLWHHVEGGHWSAWAYASKTDAVHDGVSSIQVPADDPLAPFTTADGKLHGVGTMFLSVDIPTMRAYRFS
ncbi:MAG: hypothetical protein ACYDBQ_02075 [Thermoplasmatota archaeon]